MWTRRRRTRTPVHDFRPLVEAFEARSLPSGAGFGAAHAAAAGPDHGRRDDPPPGLVRSADAADGAGRPAQANPKSERSRGAKGGSNGIGRIVSGWAPGTNGRELSARIHELHSSRRGGGVEGQPPAPDTGGSGTGGGAGGTGTPTAVTPTRPPSGGTSPADTPGVGTVARDPGREGPARAESPLPGPAGPGREDTPPPTPASAGEPAPTAAPARGVRAGTNLSAAPPREGTYPAGTPGGLAVSGGGHLSAGGVTVGPAAGGEGAPPPATDGEGKPGSTAAAGGLTVVAGESLGAGLLPLAAGANAVFTVPMTAAGESADLGPLAVDLLADLPVYLSPGDGGVLAGAVDRLLEWASADAARGWLPWVSAAALAAVALETARRQLRRAGDGTGVPDIPGASAGTWLPGQA